MRRYSSAELQELAAGYALGAASEEEAAAVEQALPESPELAAEVAAYREVAVRIAQQRAVTPPRDLRDRLMARVRETPQQGGSVPPGAMPSADPKVVPITSAASATGGVRPAPTRRPVWMAAGLAASLLLAAALGWQNARLRRALVALDARTGELESQLAAAQQDVRTRVRQLDRILRAENELYVAQMTLTASNDRADAPGIQFFWNEKQKVAMLHAFRLPPAPAGRSYQLWLIQDGKPVSASVFNSEADGHALVENIQIPNSASGVTQVLVTEEPAGGSPLPTTTPFLGGKLSKT